MLVPHTSVVVMPNPDATDKRYHWLKYGGRGAFIVLRLAAESSTPVYDLTMGEKLLMITRTPVFR